MLLFNQADSILTLEIGTPIANKYTEDEKNYTLLDKKTSVNINLCIRTKCRFSVTKTNYNSSNINYKTK